MEMHYSCVPLMGRLGKASAADGTIENATVVGFANATVSANDTVKVVVTGLKTLSSLNAGDLFFLSDSTAGAITTSAPSGAGKAVDSCRRSINCN